MVFKGVETGLQEGFLQISGELQGYFRGMQQDSKRFQEDF